MCFYTPLCANTFNVFLARPSDDLLNATALHILIHTSPSSSSAASSIAGENSLKAIIGLQGFIDGHRRSVPCAIPPPPIDPIKSALTTKATDFSFVKTAL